MKTLQKFSDAYLARCAAMKPDEVIRFLEDFRRIHSPRKSQSKLISMKVPEDLLEVFKTKAKLSKIPYQTQIKQLMKDWVEK